MTWDEAALDHLEKLTAAGVPTREIAEALGTTADAVSGARSRARRAHHASKARLAAGVARRPVERIAFPGASQCCWIANDGPWRSAAPLWCAQPVQAGSPYCPSHHKRCYIRKT